MADVKGLLNDPDFQALKLSPQDEQDAVSQIDPDIKGLSADDYAKFRMAMVSPLAKSPAGAFSNFMSGAGSGLANTAKGALGMAQAAFNRPGGPSPIPATPQFLTNAAEAPTDPMGQLGRTAEQAAEFMIPGGPEEGFGRGIVEAMKAGTVGALQSGGDQDRAAQAGLTAGLTSGAFSTIAGALKASAPWIYRGGDALKFPERFEGAKSADIIDDAIANGITISSRGLRNAATLKNLRESYIQGLISWNADQLIDLKDLMDPIDKLKEPFQRLGMNDVVNSINSRINDLLEAHGAKPAVPGTPPTFNMNVNYPQRIPGTPAIPAKSAKITVAEAQQLKGDLQALVRNGYGKLAGNTTEYYKALAAGFRQTIEDAVPAVAAANHGPQGKQNMILLEKAITKSLVSRGRITPAMAVTELFAGPRAASGLFFLRDPAVRSTLAIIADRTGNVLNSVGPTAGRSAAAFQNLGPIPQFDTSQVQVNQ